jgi:tRNA U34 2-thiouridine synthase MnmA/TrmU
MFPLGDLMKSQVKQIALINGLEKIARKKESMGICFIGNRNFKDFIREVCIRVVFRVFVTNNYSMLKTSVAISST